MKILQKECKIHGVVDHVRSQEKDTIRYRCKRCRIDAVNKRRRKLKEMAIEYKGGKCEKCAYNKCVDALEFHHLDPNKKDFNISSGYTRSWQKIILELDKCVLVCANCHREIHSDINKGV